MHLINDMAAQTTHCAMGTVMTHKAFGPHAEESLSAVCREVTRIEELLSCFLPESDISRVNRSAGLKSEKVDLETLAVLSKALEFSRRFPAFFDVTIRPLVALWNSSRDLPAGPQAAAIERTLALVNYRDLALNPWEKSAGLKHLGQALDLGGIGKGFAADRLVAVLKEVEVASAYSNLGGNVVALGAKPDGSAWRIGIQHPRHENRLLGAVAVIDRSVVTSGDYQRYFIDGRGNRRHHILNPTTGYPCESGLVSVSIVAESSLVADALSTIVFAAGMEKGLEIIKQYPQTEAVLVDTDMQVFVTRGLADCFLADEGVRVNTLTE